ncbi:MAG: ABC transporter ATP-binding protein [Bacteroidetes bacterium]|nr:ABC transporter ATP-binding protein [Bacteroidota bacterium]
MVFSLGSFAMVQPFLELLFGKTELIYVAPKLTLSSQSLIENLRFLISKIIIAYGKLEALLFICILVIILFIFKNFFRYMGLYYIAPIRNGVVKDLRNKMYTKVLELPLSFYSENKKGDTISRITSDVQEIEWSIMCSLVMAFRDPITIIGYIIALFIISPYLTFYALILLPITAFVINRIGKSLKRKSAVVQQKMGTILSVIEETLTGLRIIKAFNAFQFSRDNFHEINSDYKRRMISIYRRRDLAAPVSEFLGTIVIVVVLLIGGKMVLSPGSSLNAAVFITYLVIFSQLIPPMQSFAAAYYNVIKGMASVERVEVLLNAEEVILEKPNASPIKQFGKSVEFKNVNFAYGNEPVLNNINFTIEKGKSIALVGHSGAGKSTIADLLPRFYDCSSGEVLIDGKPIKDLVISDLRGLMGIVTQESILFNDTVINNIALGQDNPSEEKVIEAAKIANAHDFIMELEDGYQTNLGDNGNRLSGGQKQRINIARAVLKNPDILILDEATSSLDTESERLVQNALNNLLQNRTSLIIAHRLSTIQFADEILVLNKGEIVERGTHSALIEENGVYKKLFDLQSFV